MAAQQLREEIERMERQELVDFGEQEDDEEDMVRLHICSIVGEQAG